MKNLKILICDDRKTKSDSIVEYLYSKFYYGIHIDVAEDIEGCIEKIKHNKYNLFFIDLTMQDTFHGQYKHDAGKEVINYINDTYKNDFLYEIIILTTIKDTKESQKEIISKYSFIDYTETDKNDIKKKEIDKLLIEKAKLLNIDLDTKQYDIAIITALSSEMENVKKAFNIFQKNTADIQSRNEFNWKSMEVYDDTHTYDVTKIMNIKGESLSVVATSVNKMGMVNTSTLATKMILKFKPKLIVMLGICAGKKGDIDRGDVIIVDRSFDYQAGKVTMKNKVKIFKPDYDVLKLDETFSNKFENKKEEWTYDINNIWTKLTGEKFKQPTAYLSVFGSGAAVIATETIFSEIGEHNRKILGIDMEAYAIFVAAERVLSKNKPKAIVIKGVQDFAGNDKLKQNKDQYTNYGSFASAMFFLNICDKYLISYLNNE